MEWYVKCSKFGTIQFELRQFDNHIFSTQYLQFNYWILSVCRTELNTSSPRRTMLELF
jgi:hypothetical protein